MAKESFTVSTPTNGSTNRTGLEASPHAEEMREGSFSYTPEGSETAFRDFRAKLLADGEPIGTVPRPASLGAPLVLLDKLGERLAFERSGTRLYESLLLKHAHARPFDGGPTREQLATICEEEHEHFLTLTRFVKELGGDPTAVTPSADVAGVASMGIVQVVCDPRVGLGESLEAILIAELVDNECWQTLCDLAQEAGNEELVRFAERAAEQEGRHLERVRSWVQARTLGERAAAT
jgi:rubrerythrin